MNNQSNPSPLASLRPLVLAALFMVCGILVLIYLGRDTARLMKGPLGEVELKPLLNAESSIDGQSILGKVTILHFWGAWCPPCREEFPEFVDIYRALKNDSRIQILSISCSGGPEKDLAALKEQTESFMRRYETDLPTYCDPVMFTRASIARMLAAGGFAYPFTLIVDRDGIVQDFWRGYHKGGMAKAAAKARVLAESSEVK
jgi:cytochrome c biogenesis protein CcmG, thiol:disulfide interchange protein DsbE